MERMLIVYYSWSNGNTERIVKELQKATSADIEKIETVDGYKGTYREVVEQGKKEVEQGFMPKLKKMEHDINDYDVIAVGTPTWWYTMAPAVLTFLRENNWNGKTIIPFMTNGGWPGHVIADIKNECTGAESICEKEIQFDSNGGNILETPMDEIEQWIMEIKKQINL